jgi:hypothetical protein
MMRPSRIGLIALALLVGLGCAGATANRGKQYAQDGVLPRPPVLVVYDFAVDTDSVMVDTFGPNFFQNTNNPSKENATARAVANSLSEALVEELDKRGIHAQRAASSTPPVDAVVVKGQFLTIEEGDRATRMLIGFGRGAEKLQIRVQAYQVTERGLRRLVESEGEAYGDKMPGMAVPMGAGAAMGKVARSAAISGGMNVMQEVRAGLDAAAKNMAKELADRAVSFYTRQGWR